MSICPHFEYSPELPRAPKTRLNEFANNGWHIPLHFFIIFFSPFLLYFPSKQEPAPSRPAAPALCATPCPHQHASKKHCAVRPRPETWRWLQDASNVFSEITSFFRVLTWSRAHTWPREHLSHRPRCAFGAAPNSNSAFLS